MIHGANEKLEENVYGIIEKIFRDVEKKERERREERNKERK